MTWDLPLVGRHKELAELKHHLKAAEEGRGGVLLIAGRSGMGKTSLIRAAVTDHGGRLLLATGFCPGQHETPPFGPWVEVLAALATLTGIDLRSLPPPFGEAQGQWASIGLAAELSSWLGATDRPLVVVLEDIQWADPASLDLIRHFEPHLRQIGLLIIATYRSEEVQRDHPIWTLVPHLQRGGGALIELHPLELADVQELLQAVFPGRDEGEVRSLAARIHARTEGHSLFVRELVRAIAGEDRRAERLEQLPLPHTIWQAIDADLNRLSPQTLEALQIGAVMGERFEFDLLADVASLPEPELAAVLEEALSFQIIAEEGAEGDRFAFTHALFREALVGRYSVLERRGMQRRIAEQMMRLPAPDLTQLSYYLVQARDPRAPEFLLRAGDQTLRLGAYEQARKHYQVALGLTGSSHPLRAELLLKMGHCLNFRDAIYHGVVGELWDQALAAARETGDAAVAAWARFYRVSRTWFSVRTLSVLDEMVEVTAEQERLLDDPRYQKLGAELFGQSHDYPLMAAVRAQALANVGRGEEARQVLAGLSARSQAALSSLHGYSARIFLAATNGQLEEVADLGRRMVEEQIQARRFPYAAFFAYARLHWVAIFRADHPGEVEAAFQEAGELQALARERSGATYMEGFSFKGLLDFYRGDWESARQNLVGYFLKNPGDPLYGHRSVAIRLLLAMGDLAGALTMLAHVFPLEEPPEPSQEPVLASMELVQLYALRAQAHLLQQEPEQALRWLRAADRRMAYHPVAPARPHLLVTWARYHQQRGELAAALERAEEALPAAEALRDWSQIIAAHRLVGELVATRGQTASTESHLRTARELAERCRFPFEVALCQLARARSLPDAPGAREELSAARETFARLGARMALEQVEGLLRARGPAPAVRPAGLTERQMEIANLVAKGLTDREIAERLCISESTVDAHLRKIFARLGVQNRASLVARISENRRP
ncbi:MAG: helix-turn-helix transcriptional regulator [Bacillota bacterium]